ncbi:MAG TPA: PDZ domain-containing protein, partial [Trebonia sp.]|nr:PDZ domain-containing protein [Trebonia sp.]
SASTASVPASIPSDVSSGALVGGVLCGTPVTAAGISSGAVITNIGGSTVSSPASLTKILVKYHPGNTVPITWYAPNGQKHVTSVKLAAGPAK